MVQAEKRDKPVPGGLTITFSSTFSEEVGVDPSQVTAVLNIKNGSENVTVRGASSEAVSTGVNSNIKVTRITFESITITEGMVPEDDGQAIRIKALELPSGAADLCGNEFASRSMEVQDSLRQQEWLDTVAPDLTTLLQPNTEGAYAPYTETTYYGGDESRTADGFYFPVQINDGSYDIGIISGDASKYVSGMNAVGDGDQAQESGSFILRETEEGSTGTASFEYCVTTDANAPGNDSWQTAVTGQVVAFTQVDNGNYLHIRPVENSDIPILKPVLTVEGYDYAGNKTSADYPLDFIFRDKVSPATGAKVEYTGTGNDLSGSVTASDAGGLETVKYKISSVSGSDPVPTEPPVSEPESGSEEWTELNIEGYSADVNEVVSVPLLAGDKSDVYVYVYAKDKSGNAVLETHKYSFDFRMPSYTVSVPDGISDGVVEVSGLNKEEAMSLGWANEVIGGSYNSLSMNYGSLFAIVKTEHGTIGMFLDDIIDNDRGEVVAKPGFDTPGTNDLLSSMQPNDNTYTSDSIDGMHFVASIRGGLIWDTYFIDLDTGELIENNINTVSDYGSAEYRQKVQETADKISKLYGDADIYLIEIDAKYILNSGTSLFWRQSSGDERTFSNSNAPKPIAVQRYTVRSARDDEDPNNPINTAVFGTVRDASGREITADDLRLDPNAEFDGTNVTSFRTPEGIQIQAALSNNRIPDWGIEDIDFDNSYAAIYKDGASEPYATVPLKAGTAEQNIVFPDMEYESGIYTVSVILQAKVSGRVDKVDLGKQFNVLNVTADPNGSMRGLSKYVSSLGNSVELASDEETIENIVLNPADTTLTLAHTTYYISESAEDAGSDFRLKLWMENDPENVLYKDITISWQEGNAFSVFTEGWEPVHLGSAYTVVPLEGESVICYQEVYSNGELGSVKQLTVNVNDAEPELELEVMPGTVSTSAQLKVNSLYSANGDIAYIYALKNRETTPYSCTVTENGMLSIDGQDTFTEPDLWRFVVIDETGSSTHDEDLNIDESDNIDLSMYIDNETPRISTTMHSGSGSGSYSVTITARDSMFYAEPGDLKLYLSTTDPTQASAPDPAATEGTSETEPDDTTMVFDWETITDQIFGDSPNPAGIYSMSASYEKNDSGEYYGHNLTVDIEGMVPPGEKLYVWAEDAAGNMSECWDI